MTEENPLSRGLLVMSDNGVRYKNPIHFYSGRGTTHFELSTSIYPGFKCHLVDMILSYFARTKDLIGSNVNYSSRATRCA